MTDKLEGSLCPPIEFYEVVVRHYIDAGKGEIQLEEPLVYRCALCVTDRGNPYALGEILNRISYEIVRKAANR